MINESAEGSFWEKVVCLFYFIFLSGFVWLIVYYLISFYINIFENGRFHVFCRSCLWVCHHPLNWNACLSCVTLLSAVSCCYSWGVCIMHPEVSVNGRSPRISPALEAAALLSLVFMTICLCTKQCRSGCSVMWIQVLAWKYCFFFSIYSLSHLFRSETDAFMFDLNLNEPV